MKINIKAKPGAREEKVEKIDEQNYVVSVKELPVKGNSYCKTGFNICT